MLRLLTRRAYFRQAGRCYHCDELLALEQATGDHLKPRYQGGMTIPGNIVAACFECNNHRNNDLTAELCMNMTSSDDTPRSPSEAPACSRRQA